jgi:hypothetical protein
MNKLPLSVYLAVLCLVCAPAFSQSSPASLKQNRTKGILQMDEVLVHTKNSRQLTLIGQQAVRNGDFDRAIKILTRAVEINYDDMDSHLHLAEALQDKLASQEEKDPYIFEKCLKEWLIVYRGQVGEEKGLTWRGLGFMTDLYADEERARLAKKSLVKLTGHAPKMWETDNKYISRMMKNDSLNVSGKLVSEKSPDQKSESAGSPTAAGHAWQK